MEKYIRKVTRVGERSLSVVIPADIVKELGICEQQKLVVRRSGQKIIIEDWKELAAQKWLLTPFTTFSKLPRTDLGDITSKASFGAFFSTSLYFPNQYAILLAPL